MVAVVIALIVMVVVVVRVMMIVANGRGATGGIVQLFLGPVDQFVQLGVVQEEGLPLWCEQVLKLVTKVH